MSPEVRVADVEDAHAIAVLQVASWRSTYDGLSLGGFASCGPSRAPGAPPRCGELYALYAHPDVWGRGVGRRLRELRYRRRLAPDDGDDTP